MAAAVPTTNWDTALDNLAATVFGGAAGRARIAPLLSRWNDAVGPLREEDPEHAIWQALRTDWALCDAALDGPGDTWAGRVAAGELPDVADVADVPDAADATVLRGSISGLWLVSAGRRPWLCDALSGIGVELLSPIRLLDQPAPRPGGAVALWDARIVLADGVATLCRPPLAYPVEVIDEVRRQGLLRLSLAHVPRDAALLAMRRKWLQWARAPRADARLLFSSR